MQTAVVFYSSQDLITLVYMVWSEVKWSRWSFHPSAINTACSKQKQGHTTLPPFRWYNRCIWKNSICILYNRYLCIIIQELIVIRSHTYLFGSPKSRWLQTGFRMISLLVVWFKFKLLNLLSPVDSRLSNNTARPVGIIK